MHSALTVKKKQPRFDSERELPVRKQTKKEIAKKKKEQLIYLVCCFLFLLALKIFVHPHNMRQAIFTSSHTNESI